MAESILTLVFRSYAVRPAAAIAATLFTAADDTVFWMSFCGAAWGMTEI